MSTPDGIGDMIISAMSVISPFGLGADAFSAGVRSGGTALSTVDSEDGGAPYARTGRVEGFDVGAVLGETKNLRVLGRAAELAVGTVALLVREHDLAEFAPLHRAMVLGGDLICTDLAMGLTAQSLVNDLPFQVDTKAFPSSVMNHSAAQCAIRFDLSGPNTTVTTGRVTGLSVLNYARRIHAAGRAPMVLACAVEDLNARRSWITWHGHGAGAGEPLGEGCCVFLVESAASAHAAGRSPMAEVLALEFGVALSPAAFADTLARCLTRALDKAGIAAGSVWTAVVSGPEAAQERRAVAMALDPDVAVVEPASLIGDTDGASAAFQLATAMAHADGPAGRVAVITSIDPDGQVGCGVFRIFGR